jgi:hypothetical protein
VNQGYWRSSLNSTSLYKCDVTLKSCIGGVDDPCKEGYTGIMCEDCKALKEHALYDKDGLGFCSECFGAAVTMLIFFAYWVCALCCIGYVIRLIVLGKNKIRKVVIRVLITTFQCLSLIPVEIANMPSLMVFYYKAIKEIADMSLRWVNTGCSYAHFGFLKSRVFNQLVISLIITAAMMIFFTLVWRYKVGSYWRTLGDKLFQTILILLYFLQPLLLRYALDFLGCIEIEGTLHLRANIGEICWTQSHAVQAVFFSLPLVMLLIVCYPFMGFYAFSNQIYGSESSTACSNHIFRVGYRKKFLMWEFITLIRKYVLIFSAAIFYKDGNGTAISLVTINISHLLHIIFRPYSSSSLNNLENISFIVISVSYYTALLSNNEKIQDDSKLSMWLFTLLIHSIFLFYSVVIGLPITILAKKKFFLILKTRLSIPFKTIAMLWVYITHRIKSKRDLKECKVYSAPELRSPVNNLLKKKLPRTSLGDALHSRKIL